MRYHIQDIKLIKQDAAGQDAKRLRLCENLLAAYETMWFTRNNLMHFRNRFLDPDIHNDKCNCYICSQFHILNEILEEIDFTAEDATIVRRV